MNESDKKGNSSRKIFETCSKLDLQDAMNMVSKQNLSTNLNNNLLQINHSNNHLTVLSANKSLSALFRTYTQSNLTNINDEFHSPSGIPTDPVGSVFNFDIGNLSYSPSYRDLADAEIHHILDDAMFKPVPKVTKFRLINNYYYC